MAAEAAFDLKEGGADPVLAVSGDWTVDTIAALDAKLREIEGVFAGGAALDVSKLGKLDVAGAYLLDRTLRGGPGGDVLDLSIVGEHATARKLMDTARGAAMPHEEKEEETPGFIGLLERIGKEVSNLGEETIATFSFLGETLAVMARVAVQPKRIRWTSVFAQMEAAGLNALPIVALLSFFIGLVVAYLGARILGDFGASVFTVELVAFSMMREFGVVITGVILAGRTDSSFTAEIGAMKMRQEIDAMRVMDIDPMEALVVPRVIAMLVMTPVLTFTAMMAGLFGGLLVCVGTLGVSPIMFFGRIAEAVPEQHFWVGMAKSPFFALALAIVGCRHGLAVGGDVGSLGKRVTASVVQGIFMVILLDALFALWFLEMNW